MVVNKYSFCYDMPFTKTQLINKNFYNFILLFLALWLIYFFIEIKYTLEAVNSGLFPYPVVLFLLMIFISILNTQLDELNKFFNDNTIKSALSKTLMKHHRK